MYNMWHIIAVSEKTSQLDFDTQFSIIDELR